MERIQYSTNTVILRDEEEYFHIYTNPYTKIKNTRQLIFDTENKAELRDGNVVHTFEKKIIDVTFLEASSSGCLE